MPRSTPLLTHGLRQASKLPSTTAVDVNELERMRDKEEGVSLPPGYRVEILEHRETFLLHHLKDESIRSEMFVFLFF